ncbi:MAG: hypothetical protein KDD02_13515 [Phaeodactylibacter sp.]|nr:hypothetical protein [Phaeodactylibacter sp.]MCB9300894.1 hypothetical protein [Lewinellaceae bacterium]
MAIPVIMHPIYNEALVSRTQTPPNTPALHSQNEVSHVVTLGCTIVINAAMPVVGICSNLTGPIIISN